MSEFLVFLVCCSLPGNFFSSSTSGCRNRGIDAGCDVFAYEEYNDPHVDATIFLFQMPLQAPGDASRTRACRDQPSSLHKSSVLLS
ncbi:hypothetical protein LZ31DRAFT_60811 [Colletotrichum somersetense]|nr:hypothetical protein LZ31DRAFT_60811 [Colletotrichum somersetense]